MFYVEHIVCTEIKVEYKTEIMWHILNAVDFLVA